MKYDDLANAYAPEAARIMALKAQMDELQDEINEVHAEGWEEGAEHETYFEVEKLEKEWDSVNHKWIRANEKLAKDLDAEYANVPYAKPAQQGINKVLELLGLR
jgi:hypothetical protein